MDKQIPKRGLVERLNESGVICAEGYVFELERRGYLQAGAYVPEVVLEHPEAVAALHREFLRAGSDVIEALTYYAHREKLRLIGKEELLEPLQKNALSLAHDIAREATAEPPLVAGNICNTNIWHPNDKASDALVRGMFEEQINWAAEANVDFIIAETFSFFGEARIALKAIKESGLPAVVTLTPHREDDLRDGIPLEVAARQLEQDGATVVGINCARGPQTMMPAVKRIRQQSRAMLQLCPSPTAPPLIIPPCSPSATRACPKTAPFPPRLIPLPAIGTKWQNLPERHTTRISATSVSAAVARLIMFAPFQKHSDVRQKPVAIRQTCPGTMPLALTKA